MGYIFENQIEDHDRNLYIQFGNNGNTRIELLQTLNNELESPIGGILRKNGPAPYHICYRTKDIYQEIERLKQEKWVVIQPPAKAIAFDKNGKIQVAFLFSRYIGIIELVEEN